MDTDSSHASGGISLSRLDRGRRDLVGLLRNRRNGARRLSLRTTLAILEAQQEATHDGILVVDPQGRVLSHNRRFHEIWHIPEDVAQTADDNELLGYAASLVLDWEVFIAEVEFLYAHPEIVRDSDTVPLKDGRILSRSSVPVHSNGKVIGRSWYFRDVTAQKNAEKMQAALFRIAQLTHESEDLGQFYAAVHEVVGGLMDATNFYIAEYDAVRNILTFPHFVDAFDEAPEGRPPQRGLTSYVLRTGQPLRATPEKFHELLEAGEVESVGAPSVDWLGVPLNTGELTWGVIGIQSYDENVRYSERDLEILVFVAQHVSSAIEQKRKDDAIRSSERRYRQMFQNNRAVQILLDPESGEIVDANAAACEFYGYNREQLRSMHIWDINIAGEQAVRKDMATAVQRQQSYFVFRHMRSNGEVRDVEVHSAPLQVGQRKLLYAIIHDVTERRRAEQALQRSEEKYRNIFEFAPVGIFQATIDGIIVTANATLATTLGYESAEQLLGRDIGAELYYHAGEREEMLRRYGPDGLPSNYEMLWKRRDGSPVWIQLNAHVLSSGRGSMYIEGFVHEVTERKRAEQRLASVNAQRKAVLDAATRVSIIATDPSGIITVFNSGAERMLGYAAEELVGTRSLLDLHVPAEVLIHSYGLSAEYPETVSGFNVIVRRAAAQGVEEREWTYVKKSGDPITVLVSVTAIRREDASISGFLHVGTDITERKVADAMLRSQAAAMGAAMDGIGILDEQLEFTYANEALAHLFGFAEPESLLGRSLCDIYEPPEQVRFITTIVPAVRQQGRWRGEAAGLRRDGTVFPQEVSLTSIGSGRMVCVVRDITERTYAEEQIKHLAYHDALTALPNRLLFKDRLTVALSQAQRTHSRLAVLFLDLDRFKFINDSLGHNVGDHLLQAAALRVQSCVRDSDSVARLGGDEFTILLANLSRSEDAAPIAEKILDSIRQPFEIEGHEFYISTSVGISLYPEDGGDADSLIKNADTAMYQAKELGRDNFQLFNAHVNARSLQRIALEQGLRRALLNDELEVHYQPIFDFRSDCVTGMEALLRWQSPDLGSIPPSTFIPIAEATGAMVPIGSWVLKTACAQAKAWHDAGFRNLSLAVNLSMAQLQSSDLVQRVGQILEQTGLPGRMLELEITESSAMQSPESSIRTLYDLKKLGIRISLDDFGTGHSSLSYLKRFPIDTLKIDQSFVHDINSDPDTAAIVTAIIAMAHSLRLKVIAEGVELSEQAHFLRRYGCDQMQGFLIKPPVAARDFIAAMTEGVLSPDPKS